MAQRVKSFSRGCSVNEIEAKGRKWMELSPEFFPRLSSANQIEAVQ